MRALALAREKALRDEISKLSWARKEGRTEGEKKGRAEGERRGRAEEKIQIAKSLLSKGMGFLEISEITGLPELEIAKLNEQKHESADKEAE
jgi:predicted transposase/invertase (TIGR01784 family)